MMHYTQSKLGTIYYRKEDLPADTVKCIEEKGFAPHPFSTHGLFHNTFLYANYTPPPPIVTKGNLWPQHVRGVQLRPDGPPHRAVWIKGVSLDGAWAHSGLCLADVGFSAGFTDFMSECVLFLTDQAPTLVFLTEHIKKELLHYLSADGSIAKLETVSVNDHVELKCLEGMRRSMKRLVFNV